MGRLKADQISLAKFTIDRAQQLPKMEVLAALTNSRTGQTHGWLDGSGVQWSEKTNKALEALMRSLEEDLARTHFEGAQVVDADTSPTEGQPRGLQVPSGGLSEHLGTVDDVPSA